MRVTVVNYRWRSWAEDVRTFGNRKRAEAHVIAAAVEHGDDAQPVATLEAAVAALNAAGHSVYINDCEVL